MTEMIPGTVTLADIFRVMSAMQADMAKVATRLEVINSRNQNADEIHHDHESRLRVIEAATPKNLDIRLGALEAARWRAQGMATLFGALSGGVVATLIAYLLTHH